MALAPHPLSTRRRSGVLLHIASLPGGNLGDDAFRFVDFLAESGFHIWQILPVCPTDAEGSPYNGSSAFAGNPQFIDRDFLRREPYGVHCDIDAEEIVLWRQSVTVCREQADDWAAYTQFVADNSYWLPDFALYVLLKREYGGSWVTWPDRYRRRDASALAQYGEQHREDIDGICFQQYCFFRQWGELKRYANERSILIIGDMPIFVAHDSADCWANQEMFLLDALGQPTMVAGVPPDYFSETGQRWGNPQYNWPLMQEQKFHWWIGRFRFCFACYDLIRVDHFRGFEACWFIDAAEEFAINGYWQAVPGEALFAETLEQLGELPIIAEDLGIITPEVEALRDKFELPGMKILQFAFDGSEDNPYLPCNHIENSVVYTGTHDNDTILGWFTALSDEERGRVLETLDGEGEMPWLMISVALQSVANTVIVPMQDLLSLGAEARMNTPGTIENNWRWRFQWSQVDRQLPQKLVQLNAEAKRD